MVNTKQCILYIIILILILSSTGVLLYTDSSGNNNYNSVDKELISKSKQVVAVEDKKNNISCIEEKCSTPIVKLLSKENQTNNNRICVYIYLKQSSDFKSIETYVNETTNIDSKNNIIVGWIYQKNLEKLASLDSVYAIREVIPPEVKTGSVVTGGDNIHNTDKVREIHGQDGSEIKIGVISDSVDGMNESLDSGDLPDNLNVLNDSSGRGEGTAMLEIIHDMVPEAELYFHSAGDNILEFNSAVDALINAGCKVIVDDIGWKREPFFEDGIVASHVANAVENNDIVYVTAAGNDGKNHYQGTYRGNKLDFHNESFEISIAPNGSIDIVLQWNDRFGTSSNDYDLYLFKTDNWEMIDRSTNVQDGNDDPLEYISYTNPTESTISAEISIKNYNSEASKRVLELYIYTDNNETKFNSQILPQNVVASDSIYGHPAVHDVVTVGAINTETQIEPFSSQGPVTIYHPDHETRPKPDVVGVNGIRVSGAGGFSEKFYGTSASAPHIAAVAAQLWSGFPSMTGKGIREAMYYSAVDMGVEGYDYTYGHGSVDALRAYEYLSSIQDSSLLNQTFDNRTNNNNDIGLKKFEKQEINNNSSMKSTTETQSKDTDDQNQQPEHPDVETPGFGVVHAVMGLITALFCIKRFAK
ncbi:MAG: S8 family serine peptidase [Methanohalobium sp.]